MIALLSSTGAVIKTFPDFLIQSQEPIVLGMHRVFGFVTERAAKGRERGRELFSDLRRSRRREGDWLFRFVIEADSTSRKFSLKSLSQCEALQVSDGEWELKSKQGIFRFTQQDTVHAQPLVLNASSDPGSLRQALALSGFLIAAIFGSAWLLSSQPDPLTEKEEVITDPVKIIQRRAVVVPSSIGIQSKNPVEQKVEKYKRAVEQNLGFLGLVGNAKLKKALGGAPLELAQVSPGAGAGGPAGSGGEVLIGLGKGVKRATVGNTGVEGLGGVGTKGRGGGEGGYGTTQIGSGEGRGISTLALSENIVLEGGLDRSVIQATIAKYLSQIRACYEQGLSRRPGLNGQVTMNFEIGGAGRLNYAQVAKSSLGDREVENCISHRMMGWNFPKPVGGVSVKVRYPFVLRPVGS